MTDTQSHGSIGPQGRAYASTCHLCRAYKLNFATDHQAEQWLKNHLYYAHHLRKSQIVISPPRNTATSRHGVPQPQATTEEPGEPTARERECLDAVRHNVEAYKALRFFCKKTDLSEQEWITVFVWTAWAPQNFREPEFSPKELQRMARNLDKIAATIETLNASRLFRFDPQLRSFRQLPDFLQRYIGSLDKKASNALAFRRVYRARSKGVNFRHQMESNLLQFVRSQTGRLYREKVAAILRVINPLAGLRPVSASALRKRDWRKRD